MFISARDGDPVRTLELALQAVIDADSVEAKLRAGAKAGSYAGRTADERLAAATEAGVITPAEAQRVRRARALVAEVIRVDDFAQDGARALGELFDLGLGFGHRLSRQYEWGVMPSVKNAGRARQSKSMQDPGHPPDLLAAARGACD